MKISGDKGMVYIAGTLAPNRSNWSIDVSRELREARVFNASTGASWVDQGMGFMSWSGSADGYYEDTGTETLVAASHGATSEKIILLYENRLGSGSLRYWYGTAWVDLSESVSVDGFVELNVTLTGTGALLRFP